MRTRSATSFPTCSNTPTCRTSPARWPQRAGACRRRRCGGTEAGSRRGPPGVRQRTERPGSARSQWSPESILASLALKLLLFSATSRSVSITGCGYSANREGHTPVELLLAAETTTEFRAHGCYAVVLEHRVGKLRSSRSAGDWGHLAKTNLLAGRTNPGGGQTVEPARAVGPHRADVLPPADLPSCPEHRRRKRLPPPPSEQESQCRSRRTSTG